MIDVFLLIIFWQPLTIEDFNFDSEVCNLSLRYVAHRGDHLCSVLHTAEIDSVVCTEIISVVWAHHKDNLHGILQHTVETITSVCNTPRGSSPRYVAHHEDNLCDVLQTAEIISAVCFTLRRSSQQCATYRGYHLSGVQHTADIISAVSCTPQRQLCDSISQLKQNRIQKYFSLFIRGSDGFVSWKKLRGRKSRGTLTHFKLPLTIWQLGKANWKFSTDKS